MKTATAAVLAATLIASPAKASADCGDAGQDPCTGPVPTVDQVLEILNVMADPDIPAANKTNIVTPGFTPDEAGTIDDHLTRIKVFGGILPLPFVVTNIQPAPNSLAGATVEITGNLWQRTNPHPVVLVDQGGHWMITHDTAVAELDVIWRTSHSPPRRYVPGFAL
jgi:hypothetical protein